jgi:outer membrane protein assembly factor BamE (lipoprotein component of BamABCDE complex)
LRPLRVVAKTIKWAVISVVLAVVAFVVLVVVSVGLALHESNQQARRAEAGFAHVKYRMTKAQVRGLLGTPGEVDVVAGDVCWYYGGIVAPGHEVCFRRGRLASKSRWN